MIRIGLALGVTLLAGAQVPAEPLRSKIQLSLSTVDGPLYERAPVPLRIVVQNITSEPLAVNLVLKPVFQEFVKVQYRRLPDAFQTLAYTREWDWPGHPDLEHFTLEPYQHKGFYLSLAADPSRKAFVFDRAGEYEVQLVCDVSRSRDKQDTLATPPLRLQIEPAPSSELTALKDWDVDLAIFAQNDGGYGTRPRFRLGALRAVKFINAHPDSAYSRALLAKTAQTLDVLDREGVALTDDEIAMLGRLKWIPHEALQWRQ